jgi:hypothetical protein
MSTLLLPLVPQLLPGKQKADSMPPAIQIDLKGNILHLSIPDQVDEGELQSIYTDLRFAVADLQPGFHITVDFLQWVDTTLATTETLEKILAYPASFKVGKIVIVADKKQPIFEQVMGLIQIISSLDVVYAANSKEAEVRLASPPLHPQRRGFRFHLDWLQVTYRKGEKRGSGHLINISTSGCAVRESSLVVAVNEEILITLDFDPHPELPDSLELPAKIIRVKSDLFCAEFKDLNCLQQMEMSKRFAHELRLQKKHLSY